MSRKQGTRQRPPKRAGYRGVWLMDRPLPIYAGVLRDTFANLPWELALSPTLFSDVDIWGQKQNWERPTIFILAEYEKKLGVPATVLAWDISPIIEFHQLVIKMQQQYGSLYMYVERGSSLVTLAYMDDNYQFVEIKITDISNIDLFLEFNK